MRATHPDPTNEEVIYKINQMRIKLAATLAVASTLLAPAFVFASIHTAFAPSTIVTRANTKQKVVALTFDADMTPKMLKHLQQGKVTSWYNAAVIKDLEDANIPATLFLTGMWIETYATTTVELSKNPLFEVGNHSYSHGGFTSKCFGLNQVPESQDLSEIQKTDELLSKYAAQHVKLFRFPGLCFDKDDVAAAHASGYVVVDGDVYGDDGFQKDASKIVQNVISKVRPGSIVILHMHGGPNAPQTAVALPIIIQKLKDKGYSFVKVTDLLKIGQSDTNTTQ